jgi:uncharacterized delta-60 repeat protein
VFLSLVVSTKAVVPGQVDQTFARGVVETHAGGSSVEIVAGVLSDGSAIVSALYSQSTFLFLGSSYLTRYMADGVPDLNPQAALPDLIAISVCKNSGGGFLVAGRDLNNAAEIRRISPDGTLDPSFGVNGVVALESEYGVAPHLLNRNLLILRQPNGDGRFWVVGHSNVTDGIIISRYLSGGAIDTTFASGGLARVPFVANSAALQADGKLLVVGKFYDYESLNSRFAIARLMPDGTLDAGFGTSGSLIWNISSDDWLCDVLVQEDGKIVAVGRSNTNQVVVRLTETGSLDTTFDGDGYAASPGFLASNASRCCLDTAGRIIVTGEHGTTLGDYEVERHVLCYAQDGTLHLGFGNSGITELGIQARSETVYDYFKTDNSFAATVNEGKILLGFEAWDKWSGVDRYSLLRLMPDGSVDPTYGDGMMRLPTDSYYNNRSSRTIKESSGRILVPSITYRTFSVSGDGLSEVHALLQDGKPDPSFGVGGRLRLDGIGEDRLFGSLMEVRSDGRFILGGYARDSDFLLLNQRLPSGAADPAYNNGLPVELIDDWHRIDAIGLVLDSNNRTITLARRTNDIFIFRRLEDGSPDAAFGQGDGFILTDFGEREFPSSLASQPDGKLLVGGYSSETSSVQGARCLLARYLPNGTLDVTFGIDGRADLSALDECSVTDMKVRSDGGLLVTLRRLLPPLGEPLLVSILPSGLLDPTFGSGGFAVSNNLVAEANTVALQKDGRIVICGRVKHAEPSPMSDVLVARYEANGTIDTSFGQEGWERIPLFQGRNLGTAILIQPDNRFLINANTLEEEDALFSARINSTILMRLEGGALLANVSHLEPADRSEFGTRLRGMVNPNGFATDVAIEYGPTSAYGNSIPVSLSDADGTLSEEVSVLLTGLAPRSTYHYRITATTVAGVRSTPDAVFSTYSSLESWRHTHFGSAMNAGASADTADLDQDGLQNLLEWISGSSPVQTSSWTTTAVLNGSQIEFSYLRDTNAVGGQTHVEWSDDLTASEWSVLGVTELVVGQSGSIQTVKASLPAGNTGRRFVRLRVQGPP